MDKKKLLKKIGWMALTSVLVSFYFTGISKWGAYNRENNPEVNSPPFMAFDSLWKYKTGDNPDWAKSNFEDRSWASTKSDSISDNYEGDITWFRLRFKTDSVFRHLKTVLIMAHTGASEIFLDGMRIASFGTVATKEMEEVNFDPSFFPINVQLSPNDSHLLAVRYSNLHYENFRKMASSTMKGFRLSMLDYKDAIEKVLSERHSQVLTFMLGGILFALGLIHILLYLFYRKAKENLYYSVFAFSYGMVFFCIGVFTFSSFPATALFWRNIFFVFLDPILFLSLMIFSSWISEMRFTRGLWAAIAVAPVGFLFAFTDWISVNIYFFTVIWYAIFCVIVLVTGTEKALREKRPGSKILATGTGLFALFLFAIISLFFYSGHLDFLISQNNAFYTFLIFTGLLSVPFSMSIYLAYTSSATNRNLQLKLAEVEDLSARTMQQEKEKQRILETQKETLEIQVLERTAEISGQKKVIEEKNKDITDSINYAKRIQDAILPAKDIKYRLFPNAFVLFKPKDIVSGDFYWFAEKNGKRIIASVDCTGHGVPGAFMSMIGTNLLNDIVLMDGITRPSEILKRLDAGVRLSLGQDADRAETKDGMDVALLAFNSDREVEFAGAQRPLWMTKRNSTEITEIKGTKISIGGKAGEEEKEFVNHVLNLNGNERLYIFSDGFADQFNADDKKLMTKRFKEILLGSNDMSMPQQEKYLDDFIEKWKGGMEQTDDILVIGIGIS